MGAIEFLPRNIKHAFGHCLKIGVDIHLASNLDQARIPDEDRIVRVNSSRVQRSIMRLAINMHNTLEKEVSIHRDVMNAGTWALFGCVSSLESIMHSHC
jgi:predicted transport protein